MDTKDQLLEDWVEINLFAASIDRDATTVGRWAREKAFPITKIGCRRYVHLPTARQWLFDRMRAGVNDSRLRRGRFKLNEKRINAL